MRQRCAVLLDDSQELFEIETWHRDHGCAHVESHVQDHHKTVDMKEWEYADEGILFRKVIQTIHLAQIRDEIMMREHDALWHAGRAA